MMLFVCVFPSTSSLMLGWKAFDWGSHHLKYEGCDFWSRSQVITGPSAEVGPGHWLPFNVHIQIQPLLSCHNFCSFRAKQQHRTCDLYFSNPVRISSSNLKAACKSAALIDTLVLSCCMEKHHAGTLKRLKAGFHPRQFLIWSLKTNCDWRTPQLSSFQTNRSALDEFTEWTHAEQTVWSETSPQSITGCTAHSIIGLFYAWITAGVILDLGHEIIIPPESLSDPPPPSTVPF